MPYPRAHYYVLLVMVVIVAGFWPSYFAVWGSVPWQFHAHGIASSIWVTMVIAQSWTVHRGRIPLHRAVGRSSLLLFPFLIGGLAAIIDLTAKSYVAGDSPVRTMFGGSFLIGILLAIAAYVVLYYRALKFRRKVWVHSGYMLATPLILFESPFSRVLGMTVPPLAVSGPGDFHLILVAIMWGMAAELAIIAAIWLKYRDRAKPFLAAAAFIVAQMLAMSLMTESAILKSLLAVLGQMPSAVVIGAGFVVGALTSWAGWLAGKRPTMPTRPLAQAA